jgi:hypothetical protein
MEDYIAVKITQNFLVAADSEKYCIWENQAPYKKLYENSLAIFRDPYFVTIDISFDEKYILIAGESSLAYAIYEIQTGRLITSLYSENAHSMSGNTFFYPSRYSFIYIFNDNLYHMEKFDSHPELLGKLGSPHGFYIHKDGKKALVIDGWGFLHWFDFETRQTYNMDETAGAMSPEFHPTSDLFLVSQQGSFPFLQNGKDLSSRVELSFEMVLDGHFNDDGSEILLSAEDKLYRWNIQEEKLIDTIELEKREGWVFATKHGKALLADLGDTLLLLDVHTKEILKDFTEEFITNKK